MLVSYLPFRLAQKHYFQSEGDEGVGWGEQGPEGRCGNMAFTLIGGTARDRLGLQLLRLVANNSPPFPPFLSFSSLEFTLH